MAKNSLKSSVKLLGFV